MMGKVGISVLKKVVFCFFLIMIFWPKECFSKGEIHPACLNFYEKGNITPGEPSCVWKCEATPNIYVKDVMIMCGGYCHKYCASKPKVQIAPSLADLYPGLTDRERQLASQEPIKMLQAYELSFEAEKLCLSIYPSSQTNDESDACRHFMWANLLFRKFGSELSSEILEAHEMNGKQPKIERDMDLANNKIGLESGKKLSDSGKFNDENLIKAFQDNLKSENFIILKKINRGTK